MTIQDAYHGIGPAHYRSEPSLHPHYGLPGLPNRALFHDRLEQVLAGYLREEDTVARMGGDEFVVIQQGNF